MADEPEDIKERLRDARAQFATMIASRGADVQIPQEEFAHVLGLALLVYRKVCADIGAEDPVDLSVLGERLLKGLHEPVLIIAQVHGDDEDKKAAH